MRSKLIVTLILFFSFSAGLYAQENNPKNVFVSFNVGAGSTSMDKAENLYPLFNPRIGYKVSRFGFGMESNHYKITRKTGNDILTETTRVNNFGLFTRYYTNYRCVPFVEAKLNYGKIELQNEDEHYSSIALSPGWEYNVTDNLFFEGILDMYYGNLPLNKKFDATLKLGLSFRFAR